MVCYAMVKSKKNEIRKFQTKLKLTLELFQEIMKSFLKNKCFKLLFKKKKYNILLLIARKLTFGYDQMREQAKNLEKVRNFAHYNDPES